MLEFFHCWIVIYELATKRPRKSIGNTYEGMIIVRREEQSPKAKFSITTSEVGKVRSGQPKQS